MNASAIVLGGGVIGVTCALSLQSRGFKVQLLDRAELGRGCSSGNAGILATSEIMPLVSRRRLLELPSMLLSPGSPVAVDLRSLPSVLPWFARAALTLGAGRQEAISRALCALNKLALPAWRDLVADCGVAHMLIERGMIELFRRSDSQAAFNETLRRLSTAGIDARPLNRQDILDLEPALDGAVTAGILHAGSAHVADPFELVTGLAAIFVERGGVVGQDAAQAIIPQEDGIRVRTSRRTHRADLVVVACGLGTRKLLENLGYAVPLHAERGYALTLNGAERLLSRPITFHDESCVATPLRAGLRLAGTVEFAKEDAAPRWIRSAKLEGYAQRYFKVCLGGHENKQWMGSRPSLPDSLPAIGSAGPGVYYAFGHQHLGLTQAAITARIIADLATRRVLPVDIRPFDLNRF